MMQATVHKKATREKMNEQNKKKSINVWLQHLPHILQHFKMAAA